MNAFLSRVLHVERNAALRDNNTLKGTAKLALTNPDIYLALRFVEDLVQCFQSYHVSVVVDRLLLRDRGLRHTLVKGPILLHH